MKKVQLKWLLLLLPLGLWGCQDFLEDGTTTEGPITEEQIWANDNYARGVLNNAYFSVAEGFNLDGNGAMLASASDEAVNSNPNSSINIFNNNTWSPNRTFDDVYASMYEGIRKVNSFLANSATSAIIPQNNRTFQQELDRLNGQAYFLRAYFYFELLKRYGGVPLVTRVLDRSENLNLPRNTFDEVKKQILQDCDSAYKMLPQWTNDWAEGDRGRATGTAALALKSRLLLYAASPLHNPNNDLTKWQDAADAANTLIRLNKHTLQTTYTNIFNYGAAQYNSEVIFATQALNRNDIEINHAPISYNGALGRTNPTQELVDAFDMANGKPIGEQGSGYNAANPYANRDPRLAIVINYNGRTFKGTPVETFVGGKDGLGRNVNATRTGYYMRKFLSEAAAWNQTNNTNARRPWVVIRYAEVLLNYAEALNEAQGPVTDVYEKLNQVRRRAGANMVIAANPAMTKDDMRKIIQKERQVELCFEGHRFFDVRRWKKGEELFNRPVHGMRITVNPNGSYNYERFVVENRVFLPKHYFFPFAQSEINRTPALAQNPMWP
ncbi:RagB/SusD family nutrient uptake outer membrane protein [Rufibacter ruber]|uniref:RagB/SusD family nutrient uptake outer membrane protein n=1 Tax=Rufibacter ruber TaxID=1783499 RepID=UPI0008306685|nr:RagB/SusD family nutrient uptake outer membrane protein [Rufibacter ruber]